MFALQTGHFIEQWCGLFPANNNFIIKARIFEDFLFTACVEFVDDGLSIFTLKTE
jgi:hypothetical protein